MNNLPPLQSLLFNEFARRLHDDTALALLKTLGWYDQKKLTLREAANEIGKSHECIRRWKSSQDWLKLICTQNLENFFRDILAPLLPLSVQSACNILSEKKLSNPLSSHALLQLAQLYPIVFIEQSGTLIKPGTENLLYQAQLLIKAGLKSWGVVGFNQVPEALWPYCRAWATAQGYFYNNDAIWDSSLPLWARRILMRVLGYADKLSLRQAYALLVRFCKDLSPPDFEAWLCVVSKDKHFQITNGNIFMPEKVCSASPIEKLLVDVLREGPMSRRDILRIVRDDANKHTARLTLQNSPLITRIKPGVYAYVSSQQTPTTRHSPSVPSRQTIISEQGVHIKILITKATRANGVIALPKGVNIPPGESLIYTHSGQVLGTVRRHPTALSGLCTIMKKLNAQAGDILNIFIGGQVSMWIDTTF